MIDIVKIVFVASILLLFSCIFVFLLKLLTSIVKTLHCKLSEDENDAFLEVWAMHIIDDASFDYRTNMYAVVNDFSKKKFIMHNLSTANQKEIKYDDLIKFLAVFSVNEKLTHQFLRYVY